MLKIYNARNIHGKVQLQDYIEFKYGKFDTGVPFGFGEIKCLKFQQEPSKKINYEKIPYTYRELDKDLECFRFYFEKNISLYNPFIYTPYSYNDLEESFKDVPKIEEYYEKYGLNEKAILLFTDRVYVESNNSDFMQKVFCRCADTGLYFVKPGETFDLIPNNAPENQETYEVLQSKSLGKQLVLSKLNRKIH